MKLSVISPSSVRTLIEWNQHNRNRSCITPNEACKSEMDLGNWGLDRGLAFALALAENLNVICDISVLRSMNSIRRDKTLHSALKYGFGGCSSVHVIYNAINYYVKVKVLCRKEFRNKGIFYSR
jgi:hypothetical protein